MVASKGQLTILSDTKVTPRVRDRKSIILIWYFLIITLLFFVFPLVLFPFFAGS
jgi:hypothetical protein